MWNYAETQDGIKATWAAPNDTFGVTDVTISLTGVNPNTGERIDLTDADSGYYMGRGLTNMVLTILGAWATGRTIEKNIRLGTWTKAKDVVPQELNPHASGAGSEGKRTVANFNPKEEIATAQSQLDNLNVSVVVAKNPIKRRFPRVPLEEATRLRPAELETGFRLRAQGQKLYEHPEVGFDYIDDLGRDWDQMGSPRNSTFWNREDFCTSILEHLDSSDVVPIDLTWYSAQQKTEVADFIRTLSQAQRDRIVPIGFSF